VKVHLIAACGVGMSALAALLKEAGHTVTGSDEGVYPPASTLLERLGVDVREGFDAARLDGADVVVCGNAVRRTNVEVTAARERGLRTVSFCRRRRAFLVTRKPLVVAGTHGKDDASSSMPPVRQTGKDPAIHRRRAARPRLERDARHRRGLASSKAATVRLRLL
jgi:UDP-N-acetylmuramate: L-alanyl-gamma-D-glutamyl-meso-diaminopimelate ligase